MNCIGITADFLWFRQHAGRIAETLAMISESCAELGERALVCSGWSDFGDLPHFPHIKVVGAVNFGAIFPLVARSCTTAAPAPPP